MNATERNSGPSAEDVETLAGLEQYHTGPPNDIYVMQGHQLRDWLAAHTAAAKREGARAALSDAATWVIGCEHVTAMKWCGICDQWRSMLEEAAADQGGA